MSNAQTSNGHNGKVSRSVVGTHYLGIADLDDDELAIQDRTVKMLSRSLNTGQTVCMAGSGLTKNYGYPLWRELTIDVIKGARGALEPSAPGAATTRAYFDSVLKQLRRSSVPAEELMGALEVCAGVLSKNDPKAFREEVSSRLLELRKRELRKRGTQDYQPLDQIIVGLRIHRFMTTNYDDTIAERLGALLEDESVKRYPFESDRLLEFAVGTPEHRAGVFHLHGHLDTLDEMIVTESDYQTLYLREDQKARAYREAVSLLFRGNP